MLVIESSSLHTRVRATGGALTLCFSAHAPLGDRCILFLWRHRVCFPSSLSSSVTSIWNRSKRIREVVRSYQYQLAGDHCLEWASLMAGSLGPTLVLAPASQHPGFTDAG